MNALRDVQAAMAAALRGDDDAAARLVFDGALPARERLAIYANNSWSAFRTTLELAFPAVRRLGGEEWFRGAARAYRSAHPSRAGDLHWVGGAFAPFLREQLAGTDHEVIADVAAFEWAYQEVLVAAESPPFDVGALAAAAERDYDALRFALSAHCRLVASRWPVLEVWQANRDAAGDGSADLSSGAQRLLLRRHGLDVEFHRLDAASHALLAAFAAGEPLGAATQCALAIDAAFGLGPTLAKYVALGVLTNPPSTARTGVTP